MLPRSGSYVMLMDYVNVRAPDGHDRLISLSSFDERPASILLREAPLAPLFRLSLGARPIAIAAACPDL